MIVLGDARQMGLADNSIDAIVTDPPYNLAFMSKKWDSVGSPQIFQAWCEEWGKEALRVLRPGGHALVMGGTRTFHRLACGLEDAGFEIRDCIMHLYGSGFPKSYNISKGFDRRAFKAWLDTVELDCCLARDLRARKAQVRKAISAAVNGQAELMPNARPQSHGQNPIPYGVGKMAYGSEGSRLLASLITRFWEPLNEVKQHEIWQAIIGDHGGCEVGMPPGVRAKTGERITGRAGTRAKKRNANEGFESGQMAIGITTPSTPLAKEWEGFGSGLKPAFEPVVVARKPLIGTLCKNAEKWGTGGLAIDKCRIATSNELAIHNSGKRGIYGGLSYFESETHTGDTHQGEGQQKGRWPANLILSHSEDCVRVGTKRVRGGTAVRHNKGVSGKGWKSIGYPSTKDDVTYTDPDGYEKVEDWICVESCPIYLLDEQVGYLHPPGIKNPARRKSVWLPKDVGFQVNDSPNFDYKDGGGGPSRFFKNIEPDNPLRFCYMAKASRAERTCRGTIENKEPTVKPVNLCRYLERLVARPGAVILDPFCGSGSFGVGAALEGFTWIGIDNRLEACQIAKKRREWAIQQKGQPRLFK